MKISRFLLFSLCYWLGTRNAIAIQRDSTFKFGDFLIIADKTMKIDFIVKGQPLKPMISKGDTLYDDDKYLILGEWGKLTGEVLPGGVYKKYIVPFRFAKFLVPLYKGKLAQPDFKSDTTAYLYRTQIRQQCKQKGINYGGHFTIATWGCGSDCQDFAIIDRITGKINYSNTHHDSDIYFVGIKSKPNSNMVIMNGWRLDLIRGYEWCHEGFRVKLAEWNNWEHKWLLIR